MIAYEYTGDGAFVVGLPARDITADELTDDMKAAIEENMKTPGAIYRRVKKAAKAAEVNNDGV